jgi:hypothetical protein
MGPQPVRFVVLLNVIEVVLQLLPAVKTRNVRSSSRPPGATWRLLLKRIFYYRTIWRFVGNAGELFQV